MGIEALNITCQGIDSSGKFKDKHTGRGEDVSPELVIGGLSPKAQTLVVTLEDMSHPIEGFRNTSGTYQPHPLFPKASRRLRWCLRSAMPFKGKLMAYTAMPDPSRQGAKATRTPSRFTRLIASSICPRQLERGRFSKPRKATFSSVVLCVDGTNSEQE